MAGAEWIKLYTDTFDNRKVRTLRALTGDAGLVLWLRLLTLAGQVNDDGRIYLVDSEPVDGETIATMTGEPRAVIDAALPVMERLRLLTRDESGALCVSNWCLRQSVDKLTERRRMDAERARNYRKRKQQEAEELAEIQAIGDSVT